MEVGGLTPETAATTARTPVATSRRGGRTRTGPPKTSRRPTGTKLARTGISTDIETRFKTLERVDLLEPAFELTANVLEVDGGAARLMLP